MEEEPKPQPSKKKSNNSAAYAIPLAIVIAGVMVSGSIMFSKGASSNPRGAVVGQQNAPQLGDIDIDELVDDDPSIGDPDAPVTIVEFSDFQCPFCRSFYSSTYQQLKKNYVDTGKVRIVYRDFPLEFHSAARVSALAGECADEQDRFWDYHDKIFDEQAKQGNGTISYGIDELKRWASELGIDMGRFNECLDSQRYADDVDADFAAGQSVGVSGTPSFIINGTLLIGAQPYSQFEAIIEAALN